MIWLLDNVITYKNTCCTLPTYKYILNLQVCDWPWNAGCQQRQPNYDEIRDARSGNCPDIDSCPIDETGRLYMPKNVSWGRGAANKDVYS